MGQKVNPIGFRLGIIKNWNSRWYAKKGYSQWLHSDLKVREFVKKKLYHAGISKVVIERAANKVKVDIHTARPGIIIGKRGVEVDALKAEIQKMLDKEVLINIIEVRKPEVDAQLVAESIATQLERRVAFRRLMKKSIASAFKFGAKGIKVSCGGRLAGAEIARTEWAKEGGVPLHTLRADIDYGVATANTTYGTIGVKTWIYKGEVLEPKERVNERVRV